jgi:hypothetical protein
VEVARRQVAAARAVLKSAQADAKAKTDNANRLRSLAGQGAISAQEAETGGDCNHRPSRWNPQANLNTAGRGATSLDQLRQAGTAITQAVHAARRSCRSGPTRALHREARPACLPNTRRR